MLIEKPKTLLLFSGGLDSILAAKILEKQGIEVTALAFESYFFTAEQAKRSAKENNIKLIVRDISFPHFKIVKKPLFGYGSGVNPCIDCHLLMLKEAKKIAREKKFDFIATGEVLRQRPMSQNFQALQLIERKAGLSGRVLRPLSAKRLPETEMEKGGIVDREKLMGISGRSRKAQLTLAKKFGVKYFPSPAGGCILTDEEFSRKLQELFEKNKRIKKSDLDLLRLGRHFWIEKTRIILGRNHKENLRLKKLADKNDILVEPKNVPGPTALVRGARKESRRVVLEQTRSLIQKYTKRPIKIFS